MAWTAKLYPQPWRERYGEEFDALLEDVEPEWKQFLDVLGGALKMQLTTGGTWKWIAAFAAIGAITAVAWSFRVPPRYVSSAVLQMVAEPDSEQTGDRTAANLPNLLSQVLSRDRLSEIIQRPHLDLYKRKRQQAPMGDVVEQMRHDLLIRQRPMERGNGTIAFEISYSYSDREKTQATVRELVAQFMEDTLDLQRRRAALWQKVWQRVAPGGERIEVLDSASLPERSSSPNRLMFVTAGLGIGLVFGLLVVQTLRQPRRTVKVAALSLAGCVLALAFSFLIHDRYLSTAVMRFTPPLAPKEVAGTWASEPAVEKVLSRTSLAEIIQKPSLNLYPNERTQFSMEDLIGKMCRDTQIKSLSRSEGSPFSIVFVYPDRYKAQLVVRELVTRFVEQNIRDQEARAASQPEEFRKMIELRLGPNLAVLDPPSLPETPIWPNRRVIAFGGLLMGLLAGAIVARRRKLPPPANTSVHHPDGAPAPAGL